MDNKITNFENIAFDLPKNHSSVIKVIGVGGGGSNAVNHMFKKGIEGVDFAICNTDAQALNNSPVPIKIQLGASLTEGLGAGANPEVGEQSAIESKEAIEAMLGNKAKMVFITVGMGGGTGTGAAPIIAKMAKEMGLLTVAIVTTPFSFEGKTRNEQAQKGIERLRAQVDSIIVINNNKLREVYGNLGFKSGFSKADEVLSTAAMGIARVITHHYTQNIDFKDANTVLANSGSAIMGSAMAEGVNRAQEAITKALDSPLLNDNKITGAKNVLLLIVSGNIEITIDEIGEINDYIQSEAKGNVNIIMGVGDEEELGDSISVTIVATGFNKEQQTEISKIENKKIVYSLNDTSKIETTFSFEKEKNKKEKGNKQKEIEAKSPKIVHQLEEKEQQKDKPLRLFDIDVNDFEFITKKSIKVNEEEETNKGFLGGNALSELREIKKDLKNEKINELELIPTTDILKEIDVMYDKVAVTNFVEEKEQKVTDEEEFIITSAIADIEVVDMEVISPNEHKKNQMTFVFDMPLENKPKIETKEIEEISMKSNLEEAKEINLVDTQIVSKNKVYSLEDYMQLEETLNEAKEEMIAKEVEPELQIETKIVATSEVQLDEEVKKEISPLNSTITELKSRADERRIKMKDFNYKFTNQAKQNIDELENQPAYKRNNVKLEETPTESNQSRITLNVEGKDINFRSNNSFLHDNVD